MITINLKDDERGITIHKCVTNQMLKEMLSDNPLAYVMKSVMDEYEKEKEKDLDIMKSMDPLNSPDLEAYVASNAGDFAYDKEAVRRNIAEIKTYPDYELRLFGPGKSWDLGGKVITTLELGGHTPGSILFLDEADDMVFSGDAMNGYLWMWSDHCLSIEEYEKNLAAVVPELKNFGHIYGGHEFRPQGMESSQAETMLADLHSVLNGEVQPVPTPKPMDGEGTVNVYYFKTWLLWAK